MSGQTRSLKHQIALLRAPSGAGSGDTSQDQHRQSRCLTDGLLHRAGILALGYETEGLQGETNKEAVI